MPASVEGAGLRHADAKVPGIRGDHPNRARLYHQRRICVSCRPSSGSRKINISSRSKSIEDGIDSDSFLVGAIDFDTVKRPLSIL